MKRIILMILLNIYRVPYWFIKICIYGKNDKYTEEQRYALLKHAVIKSNHSGRVKIQAFGLENLPNETGYIMFPNHQGLFDVLAFFETHPLPFTVVLKKEVLNVIFLRHIIRALRAQAIDRSDVRQSLKVINQMTEEVMQGRNFIIFAEGTRNKENVLLDFKGGSFKSAMNAKCPIVPVALIDSYKVFDTSSIKKQTVQIHYLKPIYYDEYKNMKSTEIAKLVKNKIEEEINHFV
ncbi:1-acyl-sn-glycerol-3-phosphate acyltransferase [Lachnotalea glycerini]|uniref:1-acyl-sn-glycerol-3-phosphate acyltransferase n=1 Tax=Lachnotalea glycerini TaxID=1763509 RepID=A0A318EJF5_9FIRM|nr:lysophospholipid acyltransferase family protein [Lachnotalea glycerini]PXV85351.1 1-acyl-sn-glycerol-3-phosphate acyltransferase [Lachnotalea glycerini]RDY30235.1 1-acyl-sn-glycerol-3-phosphate acyltransferase [Lachnotalea glycerini]